MSKLFEEAVARVKKLPDEDQDVAAEILFTFTDADTSDYRLRPEQIEEVKRIQQNIREGKMTFVTDEKMAAFWKKCGL